MQITIWTVVSLYYYTRQFEHQCQLHKNRFFILKLHQQKVATLKSITINQDYVDSTTLPSQTGKVHTVCSKASVNNLFSQGIRFFILADGYFNNVLMSMLNILLFCWCLLSPTYHLQHSRDAPIGQHEIIYLGTPIESR